MSLPARAVILFSLAFCVATGSLRAAADWKVIKVGRWDYLTVKNVADFYGFTGEVAPIEKAIRLDNGRNQLEVTLDSRVAMINGVRNWLCFPIIEKDGEYLISRIDLAKTIEPQFRPHMIKSLGKLKTVVLDPGHGGIEKGARSRFGLEKDFALDVALRLKPMLEAQGLKVIMTRDSDEQVPLPTRARVANATRDSIFVSIHFNATDYNRDATGFEIYSLTPRGAPSTNDNALRARFANMQAGSPVDAASLILSSAVYHSMLGYMPEFDRGVKRARFAVLRLTKIPAILVEGGFLSQTEEARLIAQPAWRAQLAQAISVGIQNYKRLVETKQRPMLLADYRRQLDGVLVARDGNAPAAADSTVQPASNEMIAAARVTNPVRREPSPQLAMEALHDAPSHEDEEGEGHGESEVASAEGSEPLSFVPEEIAEAVAENLETPAPEALVLAEQSAPPAPPEPAAQPADMPIVAEAAPPQPAAQINAPAPVVKRYWVLKLDPPPKFRQ